MTPDQLRGAFVVVAGAGVSGVAAARALVDLGARVTVTDVLPERLLDLPDGVDGAMEGDPLPPGTALVVTGPGRRPDHPLTRLGVPVVGETELAWWLGASREQPPAWLVVTGTNGKTTTTQMLESILLAAGLDAVACGNIGHTAVDAVRAGHPVLAVELSSFQLHWSPSIVPAAGCVLNVAEDHLDWHGSMDAYAAAKARALIGPVAVAGIDDPRAAALLAAAPAARKVGVTTGPPAPGQLGVVDGVLVDGDTALVEADAVIPGGPPGITDALAAAALARAHGVPAPAIRDALAGFTPGPHRSAPVGRVAGVTFVDDSKATNPHAADAALAAVPARVPGARAVWIVGDLLKGVSADTLGELARRHHAHLAGVVVIGTDRAPIVDALARHAPDLPVGEVTTGDHEGMQQTPQDPMPEAVRRAAELAGPGDVVLLAPAAASMDQFRDYAHRGDAFAAAVHGLSAPAASGARP